MTLTPGKKRGPGRPRKSSLEPATKRAKRFSEIESHNSPDGHSLDKKPRSLPTKLSNSQTLPCLPIPQDLDLPDTEYASLATSGVLSSSLERSRISWTHAGVFERYWTKPETGKAAAASPANNPDYKSMKSRGRCRLRIEPHIFEVEIFVTERPRPVVQKALPAKQQNYMQQWHHAHQHSAPTATPQQANSISSGGTSHGRPVPDQVMALLAERIDANPKIKALMDKVAAKRASTPEQKEFDRYIAELQKSSDGAKAVKPQEQNRAFGQTPENAQLPHNQQQQNSQAIQAPTAPTGPPEVCFAFMTPGACQDRFLFPQNAIVELLTPQHMLASFFVTRKGSDAVDPAGFDVHKSYFFPVTIMVEVAYGREGILGDVRRWVHPAAEAREYMKTVIATCERLSPSHLALRLPLKSSADSSSMPNSHAGTPLPEEKAKKKRESKLHMPAAMFKKRGVPVEPDTDANAAQQTSNTKVDTANVKVPATGLAHLDGKPDVLQSQDPVKDEAASGDTRRSTRTTRKSSRLSEL